MTEPVDVETIYKLFPSANLTSLADQLEPIGTDALSPVQTANSSWKGLKSTFAVGGLEGISQMLERPEADAEDFKDGLAAGESALREHTSVFEGLEEDRPVLVTRVSEVNSALQTAKSDLADLKTDDPTYESASTALSNAESDVATLKEDITAFNTRVTDAESELAEALTASTSGTEVQNINGNTVNEPIETWDGRVEDMRSLVMSSTDPSFLGSLGDGFTGTVTPGDDAVGNTLWGAGHAGTVATGTSAWFSYFHLGRFAPRGANGRYTAFKNLSARERGALTRTSWRDIRNTHNPKQWSAKPHQSAARAKWLKVGKVAGPIGTALSFASGAWDQWSADEGAGYDTDERIGRAATRSALSGGGAVAGAALGAKGGAIVGSFFGPAGTIVGGIAGGLIGGIVGSGVGNFVADKVVDFGGEVAGKVGDFVSDVGDKLAFWK